MSIEITVPRLGWSMEEGSFCRWLKSDGEIVREGDGLFELEGDKATQVVESFDAGVLRIGANGPQPGDVVKVGQVLGRLEPRSRKAGNSKGQATGGAATASASGDTVSEAERKAGDSTSPKSSPGMARPAQELASRSSTEDERAPARTQNAANVVASPSVRRLARRLGVDLLNINRDSTFPVSASDLLRAANGGLADSHITTRNARPSSRNDPPATPRARRVARELRVDLAEATGTGRNGRIRERDVRSAVATRSGSDHPSSAAVVAGEPISQIRRVIAQRMMSASHETAPVTLFARADASELVRFREQCKRSSAESGVKPPGFTELFVKISALALKRHQPLLDQWLDGRLVRPDGIDIAVAVATPNGLVTPVLRDVPALSLKDLSANFSHLVELARSQRLTAEQMQGGAFTVSSLGSYRVDEFTPILNPPQTAILGVGRISQQPVVKEGQLVIADVVALSLTFDHRVVDGAPAAAFLTSLCEMVETPLGWLYG